MDRMSFEQIDRELGEWLREERPTRAPDRLVEDVFARTTRTRQARRWTVPWQRRDDTVGRAASRFASGLAGCGRHRAGRCDHGHRAQPDGYGPRRDCHADPDICRQARRHRRVAKPVAQRRLSPVPTTLGTLSARSLSLGTDAAPIAVTEAFGSIWVANIHANEVRRYDPATMAEQARIDVPSAAWFAVADGALWVTHQNGRA